MRCLGLVALLCCSSLFAGELIQLYRHQIDVSRAQSPLPPQQAAVESSQYRLIHLARPMNRQIRRELSNAGLEPISYLPHNAFVVRMLPSLQQMPELSVIDWVGFWQPAYKLHPTIGDPRFDQAFQRDKGFTPTLVLHPGSPLGPVRQLVQSLGGEVLAEADAGGVQRLIVRFEDDNVAQALAMADDVAWIVEQGPRDLRNDRSRWLIQSQSEPDIIPMATPVYDAGIHGEDEVIGVIDSQVDLSSCFFTDVIEPGPNHRKVVFAEDNNPPHPHGTHVAGSALGLNSGDMTGAGMAYAARMAYSNVAGNNSGLFFNQLQTHALNGAHVHTNSWGASISDPNATDYTVDCVDADAFAWQNEQHLVLFAVFNDFSFPLSQILSPENAVNVLAVGATESSQVIPSLAVERHGSGTMGPTPLDGRRKPEITAPGAATLSAQTGSCTLIQSSGTSMAAPVVAGAAALVRQYYRTGYYPSGFAREADAFIPSGALIKATLLNGTDNMSEDFWDFINTQFLDTPIPNDIEGWGRVQLDHALFFPGDCSRLLVEDVPNAAGLGTGESRSFEVTVTDSNLPLRTTLAFTAPPGTAGASMPVVNDISLLVTGPSGAAYWGNQFFEGVSIEGGEADVLNNVEQVLIPNPTLGTWHIQVLGTAVNMDLQGFALAITGGVVKDPPAVIDAGTDQLNCGAGVALGVSLDGLAVCETAGGMVWTPGEGLSDPNSAYPVASPTTTTTYTVTLDLGDSQITDSVTVHVEGGDLNNNQQIDVEDIELFAGQFWLEDIGEVGDLADLNGDNSLDLLDLTVMASCL